MVFFQNSGVKRLIRHSPSSWPPRYCEMVNTEKIAVLIRKPAASEYRRSTSEQKSMHSSFSHSSRRCKRPSADDPKVTGCELESPGMAGMVQDVGGVANIPAGTGGNNKVVLMRAVNWIVRVRGEDSIGPLGRRTYWIGVAHQKLTMRHWYIFRGVSCWDCCVPTSVLLVVGAFLIKQCFKCVT